MVTWGAAWVAVARERAARQARVLSKGRNSGKEAVLF
jgi:hypothetical protein